MKFDPESVEITGPGWEERREARQEERALWTVRTAAFVALSLAQKVFGPDSEVRRMPFPGRSGIDGLLTLRVPMDVNELEAHRGREQLFLALAGVDPVLRQTRLLFVFEPAVTP